MVGIQTSGIFQLQTCPEKRQFMLKHHEPDATPDWDLLRSLVQVRKTLNITAKICVTAGT